MHTSHENMYHTYNNVYRNHGFVYKSRKSGTNIDKKQRNNECESKSVTHVEKDSNYLSGKPFV